MKAATKNATLEESPIAIELTEQLVDHFGNRLFSVLLYGSSNSSKVFWDIDILVILADKTTQLDDLDFLKRLRREYSEYTLDLQLFYNNEVVSADLFSLDAHGAFFSSLLKNAKALYGSNPFIQKIPSEDSVTISLINRIQRYLFQARQEYVGTERHQKDKNPRYHQKHLRRCIYDFMLLFGSCESASSAIILFKERFPNIFSDAQWLLVEGSPEEDSVQNYMELYETVYELALNTSHILYPANRNKIQYGVHDGIVFEWVAPDNAQDVIILIDGMPHKPELSELMQLLASWGYVVIFPRLKGTWESAGTFLTSNPADDIVTIAKALRNKEIALKEPLKADKIYTVGTSFGGLVALDAARSESITLAIALSPVYAMSKVNQIETLSPYLKTTLGGAYRYEDKRWEDLIQDKIISGEMLTQASDFISSKCTIIVGERDIVTPPAQWESFCKISNAQYYSLPMEHISLHKDVRRIRPLLFQIFKQNRSI